MKKSLSCIFFSFAFFSCESSFAINLSAPLDAEEVETVKLFGYIPARRSVERFIIQNKVDPDLIGSLYNGTVSNKTLTDLYKGTIIAETGNLSIYINKKTKEITKIFIDD